MEKQRSQYQQLLAEILNHGQRVSTPQGVDALTIIGPKPMHFKLAEGFPAITERKLSEKIWRQAIAEIIAFI
ncbi:MAG TPA: thymidylate synthase, partial [Candidatus Woesebacteria bacterium]|nr:thymidylate synthase [Candidatus Woesebacteria bacterium]